MRALLVNARTGTKIAQAVHHYPHWKAGRYCQATKNQFRQHPLDFLEGPETTVRQVAQQVPAAQIVGLAIDTTGSTPGPANTDGVALGLLPEFAENPNALFVRWKVLPAAPTGSLGEVTAYRKSFPKTGEAASRRTQYLPRCWVAKTGRIGVFLGITS